MEKYKITVFTPTYNRAHTIERVYESLKRQSFKDFEWIVIDDDSQDNTEEVLNRIISEDSELNITYFKQKKGGKHRAVNKALDLAKGELFFILDSDDYITDNALERVAYWESTIAKNKSSYSGLCGLIGYNEYEVIGKTFQGEYLDITLNEQFKRNIKGDRTVINYTDVFKEYKYPEIDGEWHIAPGVPYLRMAKDGKKMRYFNEIIYIAEYMDDGLTKMGDKKSLENFKGYTLRTYELIKSDISLKRKIEVIGKYSMLARLKGMKFYEISNNIKVPLSIVFILSKFAYVVSYIKNISK